MTDARSFETWIDGAEHVRDLVWAATMLHARRIFLARVRATYRPDLGLPRVRARQLAGVELAELYPDARQPTPTELEVEAIRGRLAHERARTLARRFETSAERDLLRARAELLGWLEGPSALWLHAQGYRAHQPVSDAIRLFRLQGPP